jgi:hypothetical protein
VASITVIKVVSLFVQLFALVKVYSIKKVPNPFGVNTPPDVTCKPDHVPPAGVPVNVTGIGWLQKVLSTPAFTVGKGFTVIVVLTEAVQFVVVLVPITEYVVFPVGVAVTAAPVEALKLPEGLQAYVLAPPAFITVEFPKHIAVAGEIVTVGKGFTVITNVSLRKQVLLPKVYTRLKVPTEEGV